MKGCRSCEDFVKEIELPQRGEVTVAVSRTLELELE